MSDNTGHRRLTATDVKNDDALAKAAKALEPGLEKMRGELLDPLTALMKEELTQGEQQELDERLVIHDEIVDPPTSEGIKLLAEGMRAGAEETYPEVRDLYQKVKEFKEKTEGQRQIFHQRPDMSDNTDQDRRTAIEKRKDDADEAYRESKIDKDQRITELKDEVGRLRVFIASVAHRLHSKVKDIGVANLEAANAKLTAERDDLKAANDVRRETNEVLAGERDELKAVLGLLCHHRNGPDWDQPIDSDLLSREYHALGGDDIMAPRTT